MGSCSALLHWSCLKCLDMYIVPRYPPLGRCRCSWSRNRPTYTRSIYSLRRRWMRSLRKEKIIFQQYYLRGHYQHVIHHIIIRRLNIPGPPASTKLILSSVERRYSEKRCNADLRKDIITYFCHVCAWCLEHDNDSSADRQNHLFMLHG